MGVGKFNRIRSIQFINAWSSSPINFSQIWSTIILENPNYILIYSTKSKFLKNDKLNNGLF